MTMSGVSRTDNQVSNDLAAAASNNNATQANLSSGTTCSAAATSEAGIQAQQQQRASQQGSARAAKSFLHDIDLAGGTADGDAYITDLDALLDTRHTCLEPYQAPGPKSNGAKVSWDRMSVLNSAPCILQTAPVHSAAAVAAAAMPPAPASAPAGLSAMGASLAAVTAAVAAAYVPPELMAILAELPDLEEYCALAELEEMMSGLQQLQQ